MHISTNQNIVYDFNNLMADRVGSPAHGVTDCELDALAPLAARYAREISQERKAGKLVFMDLPKRTDVADQVAKVAAEIRERFDTFVVLGIGGSALGCKALLTALTHPFYNLLHRNRRHTPRIFVLDNIDPDHLTAFLDMIELATTAFNVISKSGDTPETMAQFFIVRELLVKHGARTYKDQIIVTTDPKSGSLRSIAKRERYRTLDIPPGVGGRFSVLTPVGLLSAAVANIDIHALLAGAAAMDVRTQSTELRSNPALLNAAMHYLLDTKKSKHISVMMPYSSALWDVADWYRQLWAESLGKKYSLDKRVVHVGQTPVKALGVTDQHSQLQLYTEGPFDKVFTFLAVKKFSSTLKIPCGLKVTEDVGYLCGHTVNELMDAERLGTEVALTEAGRPNCTITLPSITPHTVGQLLYMFELQTAYAGKFYQINPFDQPGVEASKIAAAALLGRPQPKFQKERLRIESTRPKSDKYILQ